MCLLLMHQLKTRFAKIKADYNQRIDATARELTVTEKAIESRASEFKVFTTAFDAMTYKPDRHLHYKVNRNCAEFVLLLISILKFSQTLSGMRYP